MKRGRPKFEITKELIQKVENLASTGLTEKQISISIGCSQETLIKKKKEYIEFSEAIKRGKLKGIANVSNALYEKAISGDNTSMIFFLKNRDPLNWRDKQEIESNNKITVIELQTKFDESQCQGN